MFVTIIVLEYIHEFIRIFIDIWQRFYHFLSLIMKGVFVFKRYSKVNLLVSDRCNVQKRKSRKC